MTKSEIRTLIKQRCRENKASLEHMSKDICNQILNAPQYLKANEIYAYMPLPDEADLTQVINAALKTGKKVAVPKILSKQDNLMQFFYLDANKNLSQQTADGAYGISEPDQSMPAAINPAQNILILVPGRAFTKEGDRIGRGKGYYDRFLSKEIVGSSPTMTRLPNVTVAGVCFEFQVLPELPVDPNDIKMDLIFSNN